MNQQKLEEAFMNWWALPENRDLRMPMYMKDIPREVIIKLTPEEFKMILVFISKKINHGVHFCLEEVSK